MSFGSISRPTYFDREKINAKRNVFVSIPASNQATREEVTAPLRQGSRSEPTTLPGLAAKGLNRTSSTVRTGDSTQGTMVGESGGTGRHPLLQSRHHTTEEDIPLHQVWTLTSNLFPVFILVLFLVQPPFLQGCDKCRDPAPKKGFLFYTFSEYRIG